MATKESNLRLRRGVVWQQTGGKGLLYDRYRGSYLKLNSVGLVLLEALAEPTGQPTATLARTLSERYGIAPSRAQQDVDAFVDKLKRADLIETVL